jgi:hypothetical protein
MAAFARSEDMIATHIEDGSTVIAKGQNSVKFAQPIESTDISLPVKTTYTPIEPFTISRLQTFSSLQILLTNIVSIDPYKRFRLNFLMRAFVTWSQTAPMLQFCRELKYQLQERTSLFAALRDSYNKDVVSVRYYLNKILVLIKEEDLKYDIDSNMTNDLAVIPSLTVRAIIDKAVNLPALTSVQLKEFLTNAGLIQVNKGKLYEFVYDLYYIYINVYIYIYIHIHIRRFMGYNN